MDVYNTIANQGGNPCDIWAGSPPEPWRSRRCSAHRNDAAAAGKTFVVGVSNTLIGNGWREEMICSIKAQAKASGIVSKVILANRNGGPPEQIADLRNLISAGVNAIIVNPSSRDALDPGHQAGGQRAASSWSRSIRR